MFASLTLVPMLAGLLLNPEAQQMLQGGDLRDRNWLEPRRTGCARRLPARKLFLATVGWSLVLVG